jgi:hypothetical protein
MRPRRIEMALSRKEKDKFREISDRVIFKKDGTVEFRRSYFYRHGMDADQFAAAVEKRATKAGLNVMLTDSGDRWAPWPRDSYFWAIFAVKSEAEVKEENA